MIYRLLAFEHASASPKTPYEDIAGIQQISFVPQGTERFNPS